MGTKGPHNGRLTVGGKQADRNLGESRNRRADIDTEVQDSLLGGAAPGWEAPEPEPAKRRKKNTRRWCKGVPGREHIVVVERHSQYGYDCGKRWGNWYWCLHVETCSACGKILRHLKPAECPDRKT